MCILRCSSVFIECNKLPTPFESIKCVELFSSEGHVLNVKFDLTFRMCSIKIRLGLTGMCAWSLHFLLKMTIKAHKYVR